MMQRVWLMYVFHLLSGNINLFGKISFKMGYMHDVLTLTVTGTSPGGGTAIGTAMDTSVLLKTNKNATAMLLITQECETDFSYI